MRHTFYSAIKLIELNRTVKLVSSMATKHFFIYTPREFSHKSLWGKWSAGTPISIWQPSLMKSSTSTILSVKFNLLLRFFICILQALLWKHPKYDLLKICPDHRNQQHVKFWDDFRRSHSIPHANVKLEKKRKRIDLFNLRKGKWYNKGEQKTPGRD